jgi:hypothetical protein
MSESVFTRVAEINFVQLHKAFRFIHVYLGYGEKKQHSFSSPQVKLDNEIWSSECRFSAHCEAGINLCSCINTFDLFMPTHPSPDFGRTATHRQHRAGQHQTRSTINNNFDLRRVDKMPSAFSFSVSLTFISRQQTVASAGLEP